MDLNGCGTKTNTAEECQELCQDTTGCVQFTWLDVNFKKRANKCCLKNALNINNVPEVGAFSGPKFCGM